MATTKMSPKMEQVLKVIQSSRFDGMRGVLNGRMLDLDHGYFAKSAAALIRRGKVARREVGGTPVWFAL